MKGLILGVFLVLCGLSAVAMLTRPGDPYPGKLKLTRTTDANPRRTIEIAAFHKLYPNLGIVLDFGSNRIEKVIVQSSSGVGPDLFQVGGGTQLQTYVASGIALDVTSEAKQMGFAADQCWPAVRGELIEHGRQYAYPANVNVNILIYNKVVFERFGVPYPRQNMTWDEFFELAKKLTHRAGAETVYGVTGLSWGAYFESQRGQYFSEDGTRLLIGEGPVRKAFEMHRDMLFKHRASPTALELKAMSGQGGWGSGAINQFGDGRFAMIAIGKWALIRFRSTYKDQIAKLETWQKTSPRDEKARPMVMRLGSVVMPHFAGRRPSYAAGARTTAVNALSPHRREAVKFLQFLASEEYSRIVNEGVDALPGNPKFVNVGLEAGEPALSELEMHSNTLKAIEYGYQPRRSPFLLTSDVDRVLSEQISRIEADSTLSVAEVLATAQQELQRLMQRNLDRDPKLKTRYKQLTGSDQVTEVQR